MLIEVTFKDITAIHALLQAIPPMESLLRSERWSTSRGSEHQEERKVSDKEIITADTTLLLTN